MAKPEQPQIDRVARPQDVIDREPDVTKKTARNRIRKIKRWAEVPPDRPLLMSQLEAWYQGKESPKTALDGPE